MAKGVPRVAVREPGIGPHPVRLIRVRDCDGCSAKGLLDVSRLKLTEDLAKCRFLRAEELLAQPRDLLQRFLGELAAEPRQPGGAKLAAQPGEQAGSRESRSG